jgi:hypothetical protein
MITDPTNLYDKESLAFAFHGRLHYRDLDFAVGWEVDEMVVIDK